MSTDLEFTGERFLPEVSGQIAFEHLHRYYFARDLVKGCRVLDVACGEGYGSWILANSALEVVGVDIAFDAVRHARGKYTNSNIRFVEASAAKLPFDDDMFDAVVSFETIEHLDLHQEMLSEIKRVLSKDGLLIISSPNKQYYSIEPGYQNPFHVKELFREEFLELIKSYFSNMTLFGQRVVHGSLMIMEAKQATTGFESMLSGGSGFHSINGLAKPLYDLLVASDAVLPMAANTLFEASVHGMDPAQFYGTHLPDRVATADAKILELQKLVELRGLAEGEALKLFDSVLVRIGMIRDEFIRTIAEKDASILSMQQQVEHAQAAFTNQLKLRGLPEGEARKLFDSVLVHIGMIRDEFIRTIAEKDASILSMQQQAEHAQAAFTNQLKLQHIKLEDMSTLVAQANQQVEVMGKTLAAMYQSSSWRLTSPVRWVKSTWERFIHG